MLDLSTTSGLPIQLDLNSQNLICSPQLRLEKVVQRRLHEMVPMLQDARCQDPGRILYFMNYNIRFPADEPDFAASGLRYDITVLLPGVVGPEPIKTAGHYHPVEPISGVVYPEIYSVLAGRADYLLQRSGAQGEVTEAVLIQAEAGEHVLIPPGYGHITINRGPGPLVMANLVAADCQPDYGPIRELGGGGYLPRITEGQAAITYIVNERYSRVAPLRVVRPFPVADLGLDFKTPLYTAFAHSSAQYKYVALLGNEGGGPAWTRGAFWS